MQIIILILINLKYYLKKNIIINNNINTIINQSKD